MSQADFGAVGGVKIATQMRYESDKGSPDAEYLSALASHGVDVLYLLTNTRTVGRLNTDEADLISAYRSIGDANRRALLHIASSLSAGSERATTVHAEQTRCDPDTSDQV
ncbi:MAG: hypothetical protein JWQ16_1723 [Novosphingobium sp.]|nr:hypothetical protein [Novosphingobium sp.]